MKTLIFIPLIMSLISACGTSKPGHVNTEPVHGKAFTMVTYRGLTGSKDSFAGKMPTMVFTTGNQLSGNTGCNAYFGSYSTNGDSISIDIKGMTKMFCMGVDETGFIEAAQSANRYELHQGQLRLLHGNKEVMLLRETPGVQ